MGVTAMTRTAKMVSKMAVPLTEADKEYVVQFAFRTGDGELTNKLYAKKLSGCKEVIRGSYYGR